MTRRKGPVFTYLTHGSRWLFQVFRDIRGWAFPIRAVRDAAKLRAGKLTSGGRGQRLGQPLMSVTSLRAGGGALGVLVLAASLAASDAVTTNAWQRLHAKSQQTLAALARAP